MDVTPLLSYVESTSGVALSCKGFAWRVRSNAFPIRTSKGYLCLENLSFYKLLDYPNLDKWTINEFLGAINSSKCNHLLSLLQGGANIEAEEIGGDTALIWAAWKGNVECLKLLLEHKANIEAKDIDGWTALICAANGGQTECLKLLVANKIDLEARTMYGETALIRAVVENKTECLKILVESGAKVEPWVRERFPQYAELWGDSTL